jgi:hypothetical protein
MARPPVWRSALFANEGECQLLPAGADNCMPMKAHAVDCQHVQAGSCNSLYLLADVNVADICLPMSALQADVGAS